MPWYGAVIWRWSISVEDDDGPSRDGRSRGLVKEEALEDEDVRSCGRVKDEGSEEPVDHLSIELLLTAKTPVVGGDPWWWQCELPKGGPLITERGQPEESFKDIAFRELQEETGLRLESRNTCSMMFLDASGTEIPEEHCKDEHLMRRQNAWIVIEYDETRDGWTEPEEGRVACWLTIPQIRCIFRDDHIRLASEGDSEADRAAQSRSCG